MAEFLVSWPMEDQIVARDGGYDDTTNDDQNDGEESPVEVTSVCQTLTTGAASKCQVPLALPLTGPVFSGIDFTALPRPNQAEEERSAILRPSRSPFRGI